jgi:hypothetical protein
MIGAGAHHEAMDTLTIRPATTADAAALDRLAQLDSRELPAAPHLLAESGGRLIAAVSSASRAAASHSTATASAS